MPPVYTLILDDTVSDDLVDLHEPTLSTHFSVPHHSGVQDIAQKYEDMHSTLQSQGEGTGLRTPFEYIVVGGGTAGLALASRLAESLGSEQRVCVVEAGKYVKHPVIDIPGLYGLAVGKPDYDWCFETVPQKNLNGRKIPCSAGRLLGGSSGINYLSRIRASSIEYDAWDEFGMGWDWQGLLPYFKAQEISEEYVWGTGQIFPGITIEEDEAARNRNSEFHGHSGPVHSTHNSIYTDLMEPTIRAILSYGIRTNRTPGYGDSTGMFNAYTSVNREQGTRSYAANTYLRNPKSFVPEPHVVVLKNVYATKILFDPNDSSKAIGVSCLGGIDWKSTRHPKFSFELKATKEVIVSAGAHSTPRLLELSGIGSPKILSKFGIAPVVDLPTVGENLHNHIRVLCDFVVKDYVFTWDRLRIDPIYKQQQQQEYREKRTGVYAASLAAYGYIKLGNFLTEHEVNELKRELDKEIPKASSHFHRQQLIIQRRYLDKERVGDVEIILIPKVSATKPPGDNTSYISFMLTVPHTVSRGSVHISSSDPLAPPTIEPNYLNNTYDLKIMTKITMFARKLSETAPLRDIIVAPSTPGPEVKTEAQFEEFVREHVAGMHHSVGTASMAPRGLGGVVDENLRVYGTKNVRVVDLSIAPLNIAAHSLDTVYAIGEKGAALIKAGN